MTQNYLPVYTTVVANSSDYDAIEQKPHHREPGEFYLKMHQCLPSDNFAAVACNNVSIENSILNYDPALHNIRGRENYIQHPLHIDEIGHFLTALLGPDQNIFAYDCDMNKILLTLEDGQIILSKPLAEILGFEAQMFTAPAIHYSDKAPDLYRRFRQLYLCADFCDYSCYSATQKQKLLCTIDANNLGSVENKCTAINASFTHSPIWRKTTPSLPIYTRVSLYDSTFSLVPTTPDCKIAIELTFRTNSIYDQF